jgi:signal transduction histidine kinase
VKQLEPSLYDMAEEYGQQLAVSLPQAPLRVRLDLALLTRVLNNLVDNACKYGQEGATVRVALTQEAQAAVLSVEDQGRGIAEADLPLLFERFHRGIDTQEIRGSGLGLAIVREAVQRLGGRVEVESQVGVGSTFRVRLPLV